MTEQAFNSDRAAFLSWREVHRMRVWIIVLAAGNLAALGLGVTALFGPQQIVPAADAEMESIEPPPAEPEKTLAEAMYRAAQKIKADVPEKHHSYWVKLAAGEPVAEGGSYQDTSIAFAAALGDVQRERWLMAVLDNTRETGGYYSTFEAVYNLSNNPNMRREAKVLFELFVGTEYDKNLSEYERQRSMPGIMGLQIPRRRTMANWARDIPGQTPYRGPVFMPEPATKQKAP